MRRPVRSIVFAAMVLVAGCVTAYQDPRADGREAAVVRFDHPIAGGVLIEALDGVRPSVRFVREYRLAPGEHAFLARANVGGYRSNPETRWFDAVPGGHYRIDTVIDRVGGAWGFAVIDEASGQRVDRGWSNGAAPTAGR